MKRLNLTMEEALELHRKKWLKISEITKNEKRLISEKEALFLIGIDEDNLPYLNDYICHYVFNKAGNINAYICDKHCPLNFFDKEYDPEHKQNHTCVESKCSIRNQYYYYYNLDACKKSYRIKKLTILAKEIANLPLKENYRVKN